MVSDENTGKINIPGLYNTRDLGGMLTSDGKKTVYHKLIRSDALDHLSPESIEKLLAYPVTAVIDLRSEPEALARPDSICGDPRVRYYNIPLLRIDADDINEKTIVNTIETSLGDLYIWMFEHSGPYFAEVLRTILKESSGTVLFHCAHGKDRTGLITAIFYLLCHVEEKDIIANYAISYTYVKDLVAPLIAATPEHVHHIYRSDASNMEKLLNYLREHYPGGIKEYLLSIGMTSGEIAELTALLLP